ncbi:MAG: protoporphyrinogen oxidase [Betaproteobacteria bacterium]|nr:protoporphyrinogen oxidase [Betaproteobacteria bacterium]
MDPTIVIGAGVSGLTAAHALAAAGRDVLVLDRRRAPGGRIQSEHRGGFLLEHGPNSMVSPAPAAEALIAELGLAGERIQKGEGVKRRYLVRDGRACALPLDPLGFFSSSFFSVRGRLRLLAEPFIRPQAGDESVADFVSRRFGRELLDYVFDPLVGGLHAGDPRRLSMAALFPRLKALETRYGSVVRGALAVRRGGMDPRFDPRRRQLISFRQGMGALPLRLAGALGPRLRQGVRVESLRARAGGGFRLNVRDGEHMASLRAAGVVLALPAYACARLLAGLSPDAAHALAAIEHPPLAVVGLGYRGADIAHPLDGLGVLTPSCEGRGTLGLLFSSTLFAGRAPPGHALLTAYVGGARAPELAQLPRADLERLVGKEARELLGVRAAPVFCGVRYWRQALPQPNLGHGQRLELLRRLEEQWPGLVVTGNYVGGVSTAACIESARAGAARALAVANPAATISVGRG